MVLIAYLGGHVVLGIVIKQLPFLATAHALLSVFYACYVAWTSKDQVRVIQVMAYLAASEVLWRMTKAGIFWEFGKYSVSMVLLISLCRRRPEKWNLFAIAYFLLLIPSTLLTFVKIEDFSQLRQTISFSLSGPVSLAVCMVCLYRVRLTLRQGSQLILTMLGPLTGVAAICSYATARLSADYEFGNESNFDVTGGFGPNQVSSALGLGILLAFLWIQVNRQSRMLRSVGIVLVLLFFAEAALTFSRTGVWMGVITIVIASCFIVRDRRRLISAFASLLLLAAMGYFAVFPILDAFTRGKLSARFTESGFSNREDIARADLELGLRHPLFGVGLGMVKTVRARELGIHGAAHTEMTRVVAEHGILGICALTALFLSGLQAFKGNGTPISRAWTASLLAYAALFMLASGMRLATPALAMGLAFLRLQLVSGPRSSTASRTKRMWKGWANANEGTPFRSRLHTF